MNLFQKEPVVECGLVTERGALFTAGADSKYPFDLIASSNGVTGWTMPAEPLADMMLDVFRELEGLSKDDAFGKSRQFNVSIQEEDGSTTNFEVSFTVADEIIDPSEFNIPTEDAQALGMRDLVEVVWQRRESCALRDSS